MIPTNLNCTKPKSATPVLDMFLFKTPILDNFTGWLTRCERSRPSTHGRLNGRSVPTCDSKNLDVIIQASTSASSPSKSNFHKQTTDTAGAGLAFAILHVEGIEPQKFQQTIGKTCVEMKPNWSTGHCPHQHRLPRDLEPCWSVVAGCVANHLDHSWSFTKLGGGFIRSTTPQSIRHKIKILSLWPFFKRKKNTLCCANLGMLCKCTSYICWISLWNLRLL